MVLKGGLGSSFTTQHTSPQLHSPPATFFFLFVYSSDCGRTTTTHEAGTHSSARCLTVIIRKRKDATSTSSSRDTLRYNLELSCKTKRSSFHNTQKAERSRGFSTKKINKKKPRHNKQRTSRECTTRIAPRSADRWTMTRRSTKPAERLPCFPFSLMSGSVLPATLCSFTAAPPPYLQYCRTPITHQHHCQVRWH